MITVGLHFIDKITIVCRVLSACNSPYQLLVFEKMRLVAQLSSI